MKAASEARFVSGQARRQHALDRQKRDRQAQTAAHRLALLQTAAVHDQDDDDDEPVPDRPARSSARPAVVLQIPEWLVDVPDDLFERWTVLARPEGQRCLAVSQYGRTTLRSAENRFMRTCRTALPNGSARSGSSSQMTVIEGVVQGGVLFVLDVLMWKGYQLIHSPHQLRQYWLRTKAIDEDGVDRFDVDALDLHVRPLLASRASPAAIAAAYHDRRQSLAMACDGLVFHHDEALYVAGQCSPLALIWKDGVCSRFHVEGDSAAAQPICLRCRPENGDLVTEDGVVLGRMDPAKASPTLQRFAIEGVEVGAAHPAVIGMTYLGPCPPAKVIAHSWSKILFQYGARRGANLVRIDDLLGRMG